MFTIFKKLNPIVVDAFTYIESAHVHHPPELSKKFIPDWWKNLPKNNTDDLTSLLNENNMRRCVGFVDLFKKGFMIPMWSDLGIELSNENNQLTYRYHFADNISSAQVHEYKQFQNFVNPNLFQQFKATAPWKIKTKENIDFVYVQPTWNWQNSIKDVILLPGILNFKYQNVCNLQILVEYPSVGTKFLLFPAGTPTCQLIPMSDRPIKIITHLIEKSKYDYLGNMTIKFNQSYKHYKNIIDKKEPQCPFTKLLK